MLELVEIFAHGELSAYVAFHAAHGAYLGELGVEHEQSLESMRLLSLCSLAAANNVVPYEAIAAALQVSLRGVCVWGGGRFPASWCVMNLEFLVCDGAPGSFGIAGDSWACVSISSIPLMPSREASRHPARAPPSPRLTPIPAL